jgi:hypothetical protein
MLSDKEIVDVLDDCPDSADVCRCLVAGAKKPAGATTSP